MGKSTARSRVRWISGRWKSFRGVLCAVACPSCPDHSPEPPGPGRMIRNMLGWSLDWRKQQGLGYGCSVVPSKGRVFSLPLSLLEIGSGRVVPHSVVAFPLVLRALVRMRTGKAPLSAKRTGERCWPLLAGSVEGYRSPDAALVC